MVVGEPGIGKTTITEQLLDLRRHARRHVARRPLLRGGLALAALPAVRRGDALVRARTAGSRTAARRSSAPAPATSPASSRRSATGSPSSRRRHGEPGGGALPALPGRHERSCATPPARRRCASSSKTCTTPTRARWSCSCTSRAISRARGILIVGTYRDVEVDRTHPLSAALAELRRVESFQRIPLRGLSPDEVQRMLSNIAGQDVLYVLAEAVYRQTEGNPLFIQEVIALPRGERADQARRRSVGGDDRLAAHPDPGGAARRHRQAALAA